MPRPARRAATVLADGLFIAYFAALAGLVCLAQFRPDLFAALAGALAGGQA